MAVKRIFLILALFLFALTLFFVFTENSVMGMLTFATSLLLLFKAKSKPRLSTPNSEYPARQLQKQYGIASTTMNGEFVKSGGEKTIADYLFRKGIRYSYESPVYALDGRFISRPDFYLPDYEVYIEYWGMLEVANPRTRAEYVESMNWKLGKYARNNINCISLYEEDLDNLNKTLHSRLQLQTSE